MSTRPRQRSGSLSLKDVQVSYGQHIAVDRIDLEVDDGEFVALLGPSGCGKSSLLRAIAGFVRTDRGAILLDGEDISRRAPEDRRIGMVFQNYALFPHLTVRDNVAYGLKAHGTPRAAIPEQVSRMLSVVRMEGFERRMPRELSGGQQQRIALARALAISPRLLLLDEPLGALDRHLREEMQREVLRIQRELGITTIMVTHDQDEAMAMADRIAVMNDASIVQYGAANAIYDHPVTPFVSAFVGTSTLITGTLTDANDGTWCLSTPTGTAFRFSSAGPCRRPGPATLALRPEHVELCADGIPVQVRHARPMGSTTRVDLALADGSDLQMVAPRGAVPAAIQTGAHVGIRIKAGAPCPVFVA